MVIHLPENLREITSFKKSSTGPNKQHTSYSVTGIDADLDDIDEYNILSYGVSVSIDDEGTEMRRRKSDKDFEDSPWWEKEPSELPHTLLARHSSGSLLEG